MKTSQELYERYGELIRDAKESIRELLEKAPGKRINFPEMAPWILMEHWEGCDKEPVLGLSMEKGYLEILCKGFVAKIDDIVSSEWLYILECIEYELEEKEGGYE